MRRSALIALCTLLGLQSLRAFLPLLVFVLRDRFGLSSVALGGVAFVLFSASFLFPILAARVRARWLPSAALVLVASRVALQFWSGDPVGSLIFAAVGVLAFFAVLVDCGGRTVGGASAAASGSPELSPTVAALLGALADTAIHAAAGTRDLHWGGALPSVITLALATMAVVAAVRLFREPDRMPAIGPSTPAGLLAWGLFWLLHLELLANVARLSARTGLPTAHSGALLALGLAASVVVADRIGRAAVSDGPGNRRAPQLLGAGAAALALFAGLVGREAEVWRAWPLLIAAQIGAAALLARATAATPPSRPSSTGPRTIAYGAGWLLFLVGLFAHYAGYDLPLPGSALLILLTVGALLTVAALAAAGAGSGVGPSTVSSPSPRPSRRGLALGAATVALLPLLHGVPADAPALLDDTGARGAPQLRVVSFNLHNGFDERGAFAFDRMMDALRESDPDVVALQEVGRGWVIHGSADLFELTRDALGLHAIAGPSVSTDWGNAILSAAPLDPRGTTRLPPADLSLPRAVTEARIPLPGGETVQVLATHYHHRRLDPQIRTRHSRFLADRFPPGAHSFLLGDFNEEPDGECLRVLREQGWTDVVDATSGAPNTYPSAGPRRRIDTIFFGPGLEVVDAHVAPPWGSDHRAVIADFVLRAEEVSAAR